MTGPVTVRELIVAHTRALKLPGSRASSRRWRVRRATRTGRTGDYLHEALSAELASRHESVIGQRLREARFPEIKTLDTFDFTAVEGLNATQIHTLARGEWVTAPEKLILAGPIGTGKTHVAIALGVEATKQKRRVLFTRAAGLVRQLVEARDARELTRLQQRLLRVDVLILDELGFVPFDIPQRKIRRDDRRPALVAVGDQGDGLRRRREADHGVARSGSRTRQRTSRRTSATGEHRITRSTRASKRRTYREADSNAGARGYRRKSLIVKVGEPGGSRTLNQQIKRRQKARIRR